MTKPPTHGADADEMDAVLRTAGQPGTVADISAELIFEEPAASATVGIWRIGAGDWSAILKVLKHASKGSPMWQSGEEEFHWYYWRREALAYDSGILDVLSEGLRSPRCLGVFDRDDGSVGIWLEDLGRTEAAAEWNIERYRDAATALGRAQGQSLRLAREATEPWLGRQWLRRYVERREPFLAFLHSPAWSHPLVQEYLGPDTAREAQAIWEGRDTLLAAVEAAPLCLCHNDLHPGNLFADGETTILIDWGFVGIGHAGEDPGNLVLDAIFDFFVDPAEFGVLQLALTEGYLQGLEVAGSPVDLDVVRQAIGATGAVKYFWIPLALVDAVEQERPTLNRRPLEEGFRAWAPIVPEIFELAHRLRSGG